MDSVQSIISIIPFQLTLPPPPLTNTVSATAWVRNNGTNPLVLSQPAVNAPGVEVQLQEDQPGVMTSLTLNFPAGFEIREGEKVELHLQSNHPQLPHLRLPIVQPRPAPGARGTGSP